MHLFAAPRRVPAAFVALMGVWVFIWVGIGRGDDDTHDGGTVLSGFSKLSSTLTVKRAGHSATLLLNGTVLIAGGFSSSTFPAPALNTAELYNPTTNTFTSLSAKMRSPRTSHAATLLADGRVLLTGGQTNSEGNGTRTAEIFDPTTRTFRLVEARMTAPRGGHDSALLMGGRVLIMGGYYNSNTGQNTAELFDPGTEQFSALGSRMTVGRKEFSASSLEDGTVLITGGASGDKTFRTAELFDPTTERFKALSSTLAVARVGLSSSRLNDGSVLLSGGGIIGSATPVVRSTAELFDPSNQKFSAIPDRMTIRRLMHTQTTLNNGSVLLTGGATLSSSGSWMILKTAEVFSR